MGSLQGLREIGPALAGRLGEGRGFRAAREGLVGSPSMLAPTRFRYCLDWSMSPQAKKPTGLYKLGHSQAYLRSNQATSR